MDTLAERVKSSGRRGTLRWILIGLLVLLLLIPLGMARGVVSERHATYLGVLHEIAGVWSGEQLLTGPILLVPFTERYSVEETYVTNAGERKTHTTWKTLTRTARLLPRELEVTGVIEPRVRHRGIYEARVYENELRISGRFEEVDLAIDAVATADRPKEVHWHRAALAVGLTEPKGIVRIAARSGSHALRVSPGTLAATLLPAGFHITGFGIEDGRLSFEVDVAVRGSDGFRLTPVGETTRAHLGSSWTHPSFYGQILPDDYEITEGGFTADWTLSHLIRSYPQRWVDDSSIALAEVTTGVRLFEAVGLYARVTRATKYGLLFVSLTYLTLGLIELVSGARLHMLQYLLIGLALALFFLLLIALAEHLGFPTAYLIASITVVGLNSAYCLALLPRRSLALLVAAVLAALYGVLYAVLRAEDYALLSGTLMLVVALAVTMFFTARLRDGPA